MFKVGTYKDVKSIVTYNAKDDDMVFIFKYKRNSLGQILFVPSVKQYFILGNEQVTLNQTDDTVIAFLNFLKKCDLRYNTFTYEGSAITNGPNNKYSEKIQMPQRITKANAAETLEMINIFFSI